ncbi:MAG: histidinol-phosphatase [Clostridia bacterium]|nr:histidinol-phosphatase [Clostridia bacterium]
MERIDFHSHILPGADHGSDGIETSRLQLSLLKEAGVKKVVVTPHFYPEERSVAQFLKMRTACEERLKEGLLKDAPELYVGAEVLVCVGMEKMERLEELCIGGDDVLLLEMPFGRLTDKIFYTIEALCARTDLRVLLAHIDRYHKDDVESVMSLPLLAQVNAESLQERKTRKMLEPYFEKDRIAALGSDLHGAKKDSLKGYLKGLSKLGEEREERIYRYSEQLLQTAAIL